MSFHILIMGLPGAGKTHLAKSLMSRFAVNTVLWLNADTIREQYNDWDFSHDGRVRQSIRMKELANKASADYVICDFVAPLPVMRSIFSPDLTVWVDTIKIGRYDDTNSIFTSPTEFDFRVTEQNSEKWSELIYNHIMLSK